MKFRLGDSHCKPLVSKQAVEPIMLLKVRRKKRCKNLRNSHCIVDMIGFVSKSFQFNGKYIHIVSWLK